MNKIETKVAARNSVNVQAKCFTPDIRAALQPFVGQKIVLASGGSSAKFLKVCGSLSTYLAGRLSKGASCYVSTGHGYSVTANFRVAWTSEAGTFYAEATVYLFDLDSGTMRFNENYLSQTDGLRTDFTAGGILAARKRVDVARTALQQAERDLCYFGEND